MNGDCVSLGEYIDSRLTNPFKWGECDCMTFAHDAMLAFCGTSPFNEWVGRYDSIRGAIRVAADWNEMCPDTFISHADDRWWRVHTLHPTDGLLCARRLPRGAVLPVSFGVTWKGCCVYVDGDQGVIVTPVTAQDVFWEFGE